MAFEADFRLFVLSDYSFWLRKSRQALPSQVRKLEEKWTPLSLTGTKIDLLASLIGLGGGAEDFVITVEDGAPISKTGTLRTRPILLFRSKSPNCLTCECGAVATIAWLQGRISERGTVLTKPYILRNRLDRCLGQVGNL